MGLFIVEHPNLVKELVKFDDPKTNVEQVSSGSGRFATWACDKGHEYETSFRHRVYGHGCPYCAGSKVLKGFNDVATTNPELVPFWSPKNTINLDELTVGSTVKLFWVCVNGHETFLKPADRLKTFVCKECSKSDVIYLDKHPLFKELDVENNKGIDYSSIAVKSSEVKLFWKCDKGHSFKATVKNRFHGRGCPFCANKKLLTGFNDFATVYPELVKYWNDSSVKPSEVLSGSGRVVSWKCDKGHVYERPVADRALLKVGCPVCTGDKIVSGVNNLSATHPDIAKELEYLSDGETLSYGTRKVVSWLCPEGHVYEKRVSERTRKEARGCPVCSASNGEAELTLWLKSLNLKMVQNSRKVIPPLELDLFFPVQKVAVEYNGLYWHSEKNGKDDKYHLNKTDACKDKNIQLVHVWEDDWIYRKDIVKRMLLNKLGVSSEPKINARSTSVVVVSSADAEKFMTVNHIQGFVGSSFYYGLTFDDVLVAVISLRQEGSLLYITRYATAANVRGGFSKLLKYVLKNIPVGVLQIVTFADAAVSDGGLYKSNGFVVDSVLKPDYKYVIGSRRVHKFNFRKDKFEKASSLKYNPALTEKELAKLNNIPRIWDSGKTRYVLNIE